MEFKRSTLIEVALDAQQPHATVTWTDADGVHTSSVRGVRAEQIRRAITNALTQENPDAHR